MVRYRVLINSVDVSSTLEEEGFRIDCQEGGILDTCTLNLFDATASVTVLAGHEIIIEEFGDNTIRYFGGLINQVTAEHDGFSVRYLVNAQDWKVILGKSTFAKIYDAQTDRAIIIDAFAEAGVTEFNVTTLVVASRTLDRFVSRGMTLRQLMDALKSITGFFWDVDFFKNLIYRAELSVPATFGFATAYDGVLTHGYSKAKRVTTMGEYNAVEIRGGVRLEDVTDTYSGNNTRTLYNLRIDGTVSGRDYHNIFRGPSGSDPDIPIIELNTGTEGTPVWTGQTVGIDQLDVPAGVDVLWNAFEAFVRWTVAPPTFATNGWRITGQHAAFAGYLATNEDAIAAAGGRVFKKLLTVSEIETNEQAQDVANAFLRQQGPKDRILASFTQDGLVVGEAVTITDTLFGVDAPYKVHRLGASILGGSLIGYNATLGDSSANGDELAEIMRELADKAGREDIPTTQSLTVIRQVDVDINLVDLEVTSEARGPNYFCIEPNQLSNGDFETDLTGWTEEINSGITATTIRTTDESKSSFGSRASLEIDITASSSTNAAKRYQEVTAAAAEVWSFELWMKGSAINDARVELQIIWLDSGDAPISTAQIASTDVSGVFVQLKLENQTAPALTAKVRVGCRIKVDTSGGTAKVWFNLVRAEKDIAVISPWLTRIIAGAWVCRA